MQLQAIKVAARAIIRALDPQQRARAKAEHEFYGRIVGGGHDLIFDIGGNCGNKTAIFRKLATKIVCVEPGTVALTALRRRFANSSNVIIVPKGVGDDNTPQQLHEFQYNGYNCISRKMVDNRFPKLVKTDTISIQMTTLDALIGKYGVPFFIKIDVEGYEHRVLRGLARPTPLLSFECNLPEFLDESIECVSRLMALSPNARFNFVTEEPPIRFASDRYLSGVEIINLLKSKTFSYLEIYCFSQDNHYGIRTN